MANINAPGQVVIAGHKEAVERAVKGAAARGGRKSVMLPVSAPFHSALMKPAADRLAAEMASVPVSRPRVPVVRNVDAGVTTEADEVKPFLLQQVASPVRWSDCVAALEREGAGLFFEVGPGRVLSGLLKRTLADGARRGGRRSGLARQGRRRGGGGARARFVTEQKPLAGRVAIVTGGSRGIGFASARLLADDGASVVVSGRDSARLDAANKELEAAGAAVLAVAADATRREDAERLVEAARERFGRIDVLVNNAGLTRDQLLVRMKDEDWDQVMDTNLRGVFLMTRAVGKVMMRQRGGRIINVSSTAGAMGNPGQVNYSAAKAGVIGLTKAAARELAHWNVLVNAVAPGLIDTDMTASLPAEAREALLGQVPLKRSGTAREVALVVRFLAGDGGAYITGQTLHVNGGLYM